MASTVENIGVVLTIVDVTELPMARIPRKLKTRVTPGTNRPTAIKIKLSAANSRVSECKIKCAAKRNNALTAIVTHAPHGAGAAK